jgi:hypothetical protein
VTGHEDVNDEIRASWDAMAEFWDERVEAGKTWQRRLIGPAVERLLDTQPGEVASGDRVRER